jgi:hypothetical protein
MRYAQFLRVRESMMERLASDEGMTTAEYAVGTVAAASLGGLLIKILTSPEMQTLIWSIVQRAFAALFG